MSLMNPQSLKSFINDNWNPSIPRDCTEENEELEDCITQGRDEICESCREYNRLVRAFRRTEDVL